MFNFLNNLNNKPVKKPIPPRQSSKKFISDELATRDKVDFSTILGYLPDVDEILQSGGRTFPVYRQIMLDTQVRACVNSRKSGTKSLLWDIDRGEAQKSKESQIIEDFYRNNLDIDAVNDAILNAPLFGFQPIEIMWGVVNGYILPVDLKAKNQEWFVFGDDGKLRLLTLGNMTIGEELPDRKFLCPTYNDINNKYYNPYGDRILSSCFWPATFKRTGYQWWVTFTEKYGMPYLVGKIPVGKDDQRQSMLNELKVMAKDAIAVVSDDCEVEVKQTGSTNNSNMFNDLITSCDSSIAKVILGQTLTTEGSDKGSGSLALGKVHSGVRDDIILSDKKIVENTHNQLIKWICDINFGPLENYPKFEMYEEEDVDMDLAQRDKVLKDTGVQFSKSYFMKAYNLEEEDFEISAVSPTNEPNPNIGNLANVKLPAFSEFEENGGWYTDQIIAQFSDSELQNQISGALKPLFKLINNSNDYREVIKELNNLTPEMNTSEIEDQLTKVIFLVQLLGSKDVRDER